MLKIANLTQPAKPAKNNTSDRELFIRGSQGNFGVQAGEEL